MGSPISYSSLAQDLQCSDKTVKRWLTILENGKEVLKKSIVVNDPLTYKGISIYQSSYGMVPNSLNRGIFVIRAISKDGKVVACASEERFTRKKNQDGFPEKAMEW